jgi:hypothetical protein
MYFCFLFLMIVMILLSCTSALSPFHNIKSIIIIELCYFILECFVFYVNYSFPFISLCNSSLFLSFCFTDFNNLYYSYSYSTVAVIVMPFYSAIL